VLHPGHISGPGWTPVNPAGNVDTEVFSRLAQGREVALPNFGLETVHHVHADDVAQAFQRALESWSAAVGESFHVVSPSALTLRGFAEAVAEWFGRDADLTFLPFDEWAERPEYDDDAVETTEDHVRHSPSISIEGSVTSRVRTAVLLARGGPRGSRRAGRRRADGPRRVHIVTAPA